MYYPRSYHRLGFTVQGIWRLVGLSLLMSSIIWFVGLRFLSFDTTSSMTPTLLSCSETVSSPN